MKTLFSILVFTCFLSNVVFPQTWQLQSANLPEDAVAAPFSPVDDNICWASWATGWFGGSSCVNGYLRTTDGGQTWACDTIPQTENGIIWWIEALDANTAFIAVESWADWGMQGVYKTTDGGATWEKHSVVYVNSNYGPACIHFFDTNNGVVVGEKDPITGCLEIYTTTNGGTDWNVVPPANIPPASSNEWLEPVQVPEYGDCIWIPTYYSADGPKLYKTTDKGYNWTVIQAQGTNSDYLSFAAFQNENIGMRVVWQMSQANSVLEKTTDGGTTWSEIPGPYGGCIPLNVSYVPGTLETYVITGDVGVNGYAGGSAYSTDFGNTWTNLDDGNYCYLLFQSNSVGWCTEWTTNNFYKYVGPSFITPVELASFTLQVNEKNITLNWTTASETNNKGFEIERSRKSEVGSQNWEKIGFVEGHGTSSKINIYSFTDKNLEAGNYTYRLKQIDYDGTFSYSEEITSEIQSIYSYFLDQNYPNPFNPSTTIKYGLKSKSNVKITIYNSIGQIVKVVLNEVKEPGNYKLDLNASKLTSGVYIYRIQTDNFISSKKMILMK